MTKTSHLKKTPITDKNGVKTSRLKKPPVASRAASPVAPSSKEATPLAPAPAETLRDGILRSWLANGQVETMDEAIEKFAGLVADAGTADADEDEDEGGARLNHLAATYYMEWPALDLDMSSATRSPSAVEYGIEVNEFMFAAATENVLTRDYGYPDAHSTLLGNRDVLRWMFTQGHEPAAFAQWVTER
jgi:hypothetical protein